MLNNATSEYQEAWEASVAVQLDTASVNSDLHELVSDSIETESTLREDAQHADWISRKYVRHLEKYHNLNNVQKIGIGALLGALSGGAVALTGGATVAVVGITAAMRLGRSFLRKESKRVANTETTRIRGSLRPEFVGAEFSNKETATQALGGLALKGIIDQDAKRHIKEARRSVAWSVGGIALGRALSAVDFVKDLGLKEQAQATTAQVQASVIDKQEAWGKAIEESKSVAYFCKLNNVDMDKLTEAQRDQIENGNSATVLKQLGGNKKVRAWRWLKQGADHLRVKANAKGDFTFVASRRHNSVWDLSKHALKLKGEKDPSIQQIAGIMNRILKERSRKGLSAFLERGEHVRISSRLIKSFK